MQLRKIHDWQLCGAWPAIDPWSLYWLAVIGVEPTELDGRGGLHLLKDCLHRDWQPDRVRATLLPELLRGFAYAAHEWPAGILWNANGASLALCDEMLADVALARELDSDRRYSQQINDFEDKVRRYRARLRG